MDRIRDGRRSGVSVGGVLSPPRRRLWSCGGGGPRDCGGGGPRDSPRSERRRGERLMLSGEGGCASRDDGDDISDEGLGDADDDAEQELAQRYQQQRRSPSTAPPQPSPAQPGGGHHSSSSTGGRGYHNHHHSQTMLPIPSDAVAGSKSERSFAFKRWARGRCYRCLERDHQVNSCKNDFCCIRCRRPNHRERHCRFRSSSPARRVNPSVQCEHPQRTRTWAEVVAKPSPSTLSANAIDKSSSQGPRNPPSASQPIGLRGCRCIAYQERKRKQRKNMTTPWFGTTGHDGNATTSDVAATDTQHGFDATEAPKTNQKINPRKKAK